MDWVLQVSVNVQSTDVKKNSEFFNVIFEWTSLTEAAKKESKPGWIWIWNGLGDWKGKICDMAVSDQGGFIFTNFSERYNKITISKVSLQTLKKFISKLASETGLFYQPRNQLDYQFQFRLNNVKIKNWNNKKKNSDSQ